MGKTLGYCKCNEEKILHLLDQLYCLLIEPSENKSYWFVLMVLSLAYVHRFSVATKTLVTRTENFYLDLGVDG